MPLMRLAVCFGGRIHSQRLHTHQVPSSALPVTHMTIPLTSYSYVLSSMFLLLFPFSIFTPLSPAGFRSLPRTSHVSTLRPFTFTTTRRGFLPQPHTNTLFYILHLRSPSPVLPTVQPHSPLTQSQYSQHNTLLSLHRHTHHHTSFLCLPFRTNLQFPTSTAMGSQYP